MAETLEFPDHLLGNSPETYEPMQLNIEPRVLMVRFGDGYEQRAADGINHMPQRWNIAFTKRSDADVDSVYDFLVARGGVEHFLWTPRGEASPRKFVCRSWQRTFDHHTSVQGIKFTMEEVFEA